MRDVFREHINNLGSKVIEKHQAKKKNNYDKIKEMDMEEMAEFLYIKISKKGLNKTKEWLEEEAK